MTLLQILDQIKQQIKDLNARIDAEQAVVADLRTQKQALVADRDALVAYLTAQGQL